MNHACPNCEGLDSQRVHVEWYSDMVEEVRICNECPAQFTVSYGSPYVELDYVEEADA